MVGASEKLGMSNNAVLPMLDAGIDVLLVNPNRDTVYDRPAAPSLTDLGAPVDAVLALVNAERSVAVVEEAAALGCGGVVVAAGGFGELGPRGRRPWRPGCARPPPAATSPWWGRTAAGS